MRPILYFTGAAFLSLILTCKGNSSGDAAGELIALTRAALDRWGNGDVQGPLEIYAQNITYFDPVQERRVKGIEAMRKLYAPFAGKIKIGHYEMIDPKVQQYGETAILTFNLIDDVIRQPDGPGHIRVPWNCTQVFVRMEGKWKVVHEHWSFIKPQPKTLPMR